jgi:hypothetical protein
LIDWLGLRAPRLPQLFNAEEAATCL